MKDKRGFTLIELLAVIVILAIIALIATPIVLNIINNSKKSAAERSIDLYGEAVEQAIARTQLKNQGQLEGKYTTTDGKILKNNTTSIKVNYNGNKVVCDVYISSKGTAYLKNCKVGDKKVDYTYGIPENKIYENGEAVFFNVDTGKKCDGAYTDSQSNTNVKSGCMKFYAFNDDGGEKINLILDHNTTATIEYWNESGKNTNGPQTLLMQLNRDTYEWNGTITPENYTLDQTEQKSGAKYTIDYSKYKARLITPQEIAQITGNTSWNDVTSEHDFYFATNTNSSSTTCTFGDTTGCKYGWLYDRTSTGCKDFFGCSNDSDSYTYGYGTATAVASNSTDAWVVNHDGSVSNSYFFNTISNYGVRPVIEVLKSKLS